MANSIAFRQVYTPIIDEVYATSALTNILEDDSMFMENAGQIFVRKYSVAGLGDFVRGEGYTKNSVKLEWEPISYDQERGTSLEVDREDETEADGVFVQASSELLRAHAAPEVDAARFAKIAGTEGINSKSETLADGAAVVKALRTCANAMDNAHVGTENRILFISVDANGALEDMDSYKSQKVLNKFGTVKVVPADRFYSAIEQFDGIEKAGWAPAEGAVGLNFIAIDKKAIAATHKTFIKKFTPDENQEGDDWMFKYRNKPVYAHIYDNKKNGVYVSMQEA